MDVDGAEDTTALLRELIVVDERSKARQDEEPGEDEEAGDEDNIDDQEEEEDEEGEAPIPRRSTNEVVTSNVAEDHLGLFRQSEEDVVTEDQLGLFRKSDEDVVSERSIAASLSLSARQQASKPTREDNRRQESRGQLTVSEGDGKGLRALVL